jgi:hypothetical protein
VTDIEDQWARQALNGAGRAHWDAEQDRINRNNSDQMGHPTMRRKGITDPDYLDQAFQRRRCREAVRDTTGRTPA